MGAAATLLAPGGFALLVVVPKCGHQSRKHFGRGLEHGLELRLIDERNVAAQMVDGFLEPLLIFWV